MRLVALPLLAMLAACGSDAIEEIEEVVIDTESLTGLYENDRGDRFCIVAEDNEAGYFAFVTNGNPPRACSSLGEATREGEELHLRLEGDEECAFDAQMVEGRLVFPQRLPESCSYYCSPGTTFAGRSLRKTGDDRAAAREALDLVGDPLCP